MVKKYWTTAVSILFFAVYITVIYFLNQPDPEAVPTSASLRDYEVAKVVEVLYDDAAPDTWTEGKPIGYERLKVEIMSGVGKGAVVECDNFVAAYGDLYAKVGTELIVLAEKSESGEVQVLSVYNLNRAAAMLGLAVVFAVLFVVIGGKKGAMALLGLVFTLATIWFLLIPLIRMGRSPIPTAIGFAILTTTVCLLALTGPTKKTFCAVLGCVGGVAAAGICAGIVSWISPISGFNMEEAEAFVLLAQDDGLNIKGLLIAGIIISALGAVMDVSMSIASACAELREVNPEMESRALFRSGMNIGRDAMGTMANTLILAFAGASLNMLIMFQVYDYTAINIFNSDLMMMEVMQGIAGSVGILLTVPLVTAISARLMVTSKN